MTISNRQPECQYDSLHPFKSRRFGGEVGLGSPHGKVHQLAWVSIEEVSLIDTFFIFQRQPVDIAIDRIRYSNLIQLEKNMMELFLISLVAASLTALLLLTVSSTTKTLETINQATGRIQNLAPVSIHSRWVKWDMDRVHHISDLSLKDPFVLASLGQVHYRSGNLPVAVDYLKKAFGISSEPEITRHLLKVLITQGQIESADK